MSQKTSNPRRRSSRPESWDEIEDMVRECDEESPQTSSTDVWDQTETLFKSKSKLKQSEEESDSDVTERDSGDRNYHPAAPKLRRKFQFDSLVNSTMSENSVFRKPEIPQFDENSSASASSDDSDEPDVMKVVRYMPLASDSSQPTTSSDSIRPPIQNPPIKSKSDQKKQSSSDDDEWPEQEKQKELVTKAHTKKVEKAFKSLKKHFSMTNLRKLGKQARSSFSRTVLELQEEEPQPLPHKSLEDIKPSKKAQVQKRLEEKHEIGLDQGDFTVELEHPTFVEPFPWTDNYDEEDPDSPDSYKSSIEVQKFPKVKQEYFPPNWLGPLPAGVDLRNNSPCFVAHRL